MEGRAIGMTDIGEGFVLPLPRDDMMVGRIVGRDARFARELLT
jgi:hypothetical protein